MPSRARISASGNASVAAARFSRRWATDDVPGMTRILGARCSSHAIATCMGVAPTRSATSVSVADCKGLKPPSGKYGT
ncbi:hypothetical protein D3C72_2262830 [compost metagenome]